MIYLYLTILNLKLFKTKLIETKYFKICPNFSNSNYNFFQAKLIFNLNRKYGAYIFNIFLPCLIMEILGLLTLFMPIDSYSDRVAVTLSCLIVMAALFTTVCKCQNCFDICLNYSYLYNYIGEHFTSNLS